MTTDFTSLITSVKPKERTTQFKILAALYALDGIAKPSTAKEIHDLMKVHLGSTTPKYLSANLRKYSSDVRVADKGPPLKWLLTPRGFEKLRRHSGLDLTADRAADDYDFDVGVVCALEYPEFAAVMAASGGLHAWKEVHDPRYAHVYRQTEVNTESGKTLKVVGATSTSMGLTAASIVTTQMVFRFRPRIVVMIGIAAGTRDGNKQFGDVLVADPSVDYNSGKVVEQNGVRGFQPDPYPLSLNPRLRSVLHKYRGQCSMFDDIRAGWKGPLPLSPNRLHMGPLGAADQVIDDASRVLEIQQNWRKLIGVEMETYGVYRACHESPDPKPRFVSFKAVCDFAAAKTDSWQAYAAFVAAEFAFKFLRKEWDTLWPKS